MNGVVNFPLLFVLVVGQMRRDRGLEPGEGDKENNLCSQVCLSRTRLKLMCLLGVFMFSILDLKNRGQD